MTWLLQSLQRSVARCGPLQRCLASQPLFLDVLGERGIVQDDDELAQANTDWMGKFVGSSKMLLKPATTAEVSSILRSCNETNTAVVPQGGNTGLVGGGVPIKDEVILNLARMNTIHDLTADGIMVCDAGCVLEQLDNYAAEHGYMMPLDLGAKGSCQIGGNLATNAAGLRFLRYGSLRASVLGVEAVLPDGTVLDCLKTLPKDNTGYDLKQLFIGSEGTLGIITKVAIQCAPSPKAVNTLVLALPNFDAVTAVHRLSKEHLAEILSAFEFFDKESLVVALAHIPGTRNPFQDMKSPHYVLIETSGSCEEHDRSKVETFCESCAHLFDDAVIAQDSEHTDNLWRIRESISESLQKFGKVYKYDLSMSQTDMYKLVEDVRGRLRDFEDVIVTGYGHVGDGNLHLNISDGNRREGQEIHDILEPFVYEWTQQHRGSVSAEHGIGVLKREYLSYSRTPEALQLMRQVKQLLDPKGIMNPGKVFADL